MCEKLFCFLLVLFVIFKCGECIRCFECNSVNNTMCLDPLSYDKETLSRYMNSVECGSKGKKNYFCRKMIQTILSKSHTPEVRVTRSCGWIKHKRDCYKADNDGHLETVCSCYTDDCNSGHSLHVRVGLVFGAAVAVISVIGM